MSYQMIPPAALVTACVPDCPTRVPWWYDPGEPMTRDHPGTPDGFSPVDDACSDEHLEALANGLYEDRLPELDRLANQWWAIGQAAWLSRRSSEWYLGARVGLARVRIARNPIPVVYSDDELVF